MSLIHTIASECSAAYLADTDSPGLELVDYVQAALLKFARDILDSRDRQALLGAINDFENEEDDAE